MARISGRARATLSVAIPAAVLAGGLVAGSLHSKEWRWRTPLLAEVQVLRSLDPMRALPRTELVLATLEAQRQLDAGRPYAAWQALRGHHDVEGPTGHLANLLASRAAYQWGGWREVRSVLAGRPWLAAVSEGEGLFYLARAEEELGDMGGAAGAYRAYLAVSGARNVGIARARLASVLSRLGSRSEAAREFELAAADLPELADWLHVRRMDELVALGDPGAVEVASAYTGGTAPARMKRAQLEAIALANAGRADRAIYRLEWEARILNAEGAREEAARLNLERAQLLLGSGVAGGRELLRQIAGDGRLSTNLRLDAAQRLGVLGGLTVEEELARSDAYAAAGRPGLAARALRNALDGGLPESGELRQRLGELYYEERDYPFARAAFQRAAELLQDREAKASAELYAARSLFRTGGTARAQQSAKQTALTEFRRVADRFDGTAAAGTALFLLGDEASTTQAGLTLYRRAAAVTHSPDAREALFRVGDRSLKLKDTAAAVRAWEEYVARYPAGEQTARVAYDVAKLHDAAGRRSQARAMYTAATLAEPTSYWAVRASERLGVAPLASVLAEPRPWVGLASEPGEAAAVLRRLDLLQTAGLTDAREIEYQAALRAFQPKPLATLVLAEGLAERGETVEGIRLGRLLLQQRGGRWDDRLLRVIYPFPYRDLITYESRRAGVDPMLYAALVRQESTFRPTVKSRVGATGLGQIMPATGKWLAPMVGVREYDPSVLEIPEVNVRMGTKYFGDLLTRYNGAADLALAGYNAGPSRADRWRREFNYGRDTDAFRAAIPFDETRNYVMIVLRNAAIYERLYGGSGRVGAALAD